MGYTIGVFAFQPHIFAIIGIVTAIAFIAAGVLSTFNQHLVAVVLACVGFVLTLVFLVSWWSVPGIWRFKLSVDETSGPLVLFGSILILLLAGFTLRHVLSRGRGHLGRK